MRKIIEPCGLHCIKINHLGVTMGEQMILDDVNLHIHCGTLTAIIGKNGAGKSTLIKAILGDIPHTGNIEFKDREDGKIQKLKIGYVPQSLNIEKNTPLSVYDMIASYQSGFPVFLKKNKKLYREIKEMLTVFEADYLIDKQVSNLSGGELQRVLLSMAIMDEPNLLLLDEPISGIDQNGTELFYKTIDYLKKHFDLAIVLISHDLDYVAKYADKVVLLNHAILKQGTVGEVFHSDEMKQVFEKTEVEGC
ncbi:MAG: metal ABC transporter ATP-binding protein [Lachnospiraceae bacterium]|uniref:metal ABC transporter ATP-binding protein n=1 Tax=Roseburia hominis TaxID=301301 RepID=UPI001F411AC8|nr:metal ABC transporter ATP-binding protein [Roseburia hominis]MCI5713702.1 metal ABC transporter ATP-binding protein [Lachnospiraceae bacterium]MDD6169888.1 metal ABC transporter ATP-binding protein [Lachnospiraceae bacterium]MDY4839095.1 metal ABC transporter ATP-binding protein [Lachnospiraceae bacterium]